MADDEEREEQRRQESLKLLFEFCKHLTTLSTAAGVVLVAIYREGVADQELLTTSLVMFGLTVFSAVLGMVVVLNVFGAGRLSMVVVVSTLFLAGLLTFIVGALGVPLWVALVVSFAFVAGQLLVIRIH